MTSNGKQPLVEIERLLKQFRSQLADAADTIRNENISNYPIFVAAKSAVEIGIPLLKQGQLPSDWIINASTLEEFHARSIISTENIDDFRNLYRSHKEDLCVFALLPNYDEGTERAGARFVFIPY
jgi:hypothetical protein